MAKTILVGIGGSGAKAVESFVHLCAAGLGPDEVHVALVDQDSANGNIERALKTLNDYRSLHQQLRRTDRANELPGSVPFLKSEMTTPSKPLWCPLEGDNKTLRSLFYYPMLKPELQGLMDALYSTGEEQVMPLDRGFRGRPNIGAAVLVAQAQNDSGHPFWKDIRDAIASVKNGGEVRIFLVASIFGGTGAAGFPTVASEIRKLSEDEKVASRVKIGGALLLPYFQFPSAETGEEKGPVADSAMFLNQAQIALPYYEQLAKNEVFNSLYMFGWNHLLEVDRSSSGGRSQYTPPLLPELYAGLAASHFFAAKELPLGQIMRADRSEGGINWNDIPACSVEKGETHKKLGQLTRFAFAYLASFAPTLGQQVKQGWRKDAWFKDFIAGKNINLNDRESQDLVSSTTTYCTEFLRWLAGIVFATRRGGSDVGLVDAELFARWDEEAKQDRVIIEMPKEEGRRQGFTDLVSGAKGQSLFEIFKKLGSAKTSEGKGLGAFLGQLFIEADITEFEETKNGGKSIPTLPCDEKGDIKAVTPVGVWTSVGEEGFYVKLSNNLDTPVIDRHTAISIPDVWAQVTISTNALSLDVQETHPSYPHFKQARDEWRGLIACLALVPEELAELTTEAFSQKALATSPYDGDSGAGKNEADFGTVAYRTKPEDGSLKEASWEDVGVIRLQGSVIGLITPHFLVCPGRNPIPEGTRMGWVKGGHFHDPCQMQASMVSAEELLTISDYCEQLLIIVKQGPAGEKSLYAKLRVLLAEFAKEAATLAKERAQGPLPSNFRGAATKLPMPNNLQFISEKIRQLAADENSSDFKLIFSKAAGEAVKGSDASPRLAAVLIDDVSWAGNKNLASLRVWGNVSVESFSSFANVRERVESDMAQAGVLMVTPDLLFTPVLGDIEEPIISHPDAFSKHLLPLTPLAVTLFDIGPERLNMAKTSSGFKVTLKLDVVDRSGKVVPVVLERLYHKSVPIDPPDLLRWPNFDYPGWPWHFVYIRHPAQSNLRVHDLILPRTVLAELAAEHEKTEGVRRLKDLVSQPSNKAEHFDKMTEDRTITATLYTVSESVPAVSLSVRLGAGMAPPGISPDSFVNCGVVLMPKLADPDMRDVDWQVGIDFGTTNTCVYTCETGKTPKPLSFPCRVESPILEKRTENIKESYYEFMPSNDLSLPFMTVLWMRTDEVAQDKNRPILTYALHNTIIPKDTVEILQKSSNTLRFDLKWRLRNAGERDGVTDFISIVVLNAMAEAINAGVRPEHISWSFSYPQAFHGNKFGEFKRSVTNAVKDIAHAFRPPLPIATKSDFTLKSEGEASALYFADDMNVGYNGTVITLDIGGGTTDITIWQKNSMLWRSSVEIAGRHMFINYLQRNPNLLSASVRSDDGLAAAARLVASLDKKDKQAGIETLVNSKSFDSVLTQVVRDHSLRAFSRLALGGVLYYIGHVLDHLQMQGRLELRSGFPVKLCFGGKVSKLIAALFPDPNDEPWIKEMLCASAGQAASEVQAIFSRLPKHEVAYGLLVTPDRDRIRGLRTDDPVRWLILGESLQTFKKGEKTFDLNPSDIDDRQKLSTDAEWKLAESMPGFNAFVAQARQSLRARLTVGSQAMAVIRETVAQELSDGRMRRIDLANMQVIEDENTSIMAPPFIVALRKLLEQIADNDRDVTFEPLG